MAEGSSIQTMLFADICGSVALYETRGDNEASRLVLETRAALVSIMHRHGGRLAGTAGDGVLGAFPSAEEACRAAVDMQKSLQSGPICIKVGVHSGPVIETDGDVFGDAVNTASRVMTLARPSEILLTEETVQLCRTGAPPSARFVETRMVDGRSRPVSLYSVFAEGDEGQSTLVADAAFVRSSRRQSSVLVLVGIDGRQTLLERDGQTVVLGRDPSCDLVVPHLQASRRHATIEARRGKFVLTDRSTNGTFIVGRNDSSTFLRRDTLTLFGDGWIVLGEAPASTTPTGTPNSAAGVIRFTVFAAE